MSDWPGNVYERAADLIEAEGWRRDFTVNSAGLTTGEAIHRASIDLGLHGSTNENCRRAMQEFARDRGYNSLAELDADPDRTATEVVLDLRLIANSKVAA